MPAGVYAAEGMRLATIPEFKPLRWKQKRFIWGLLKAHGNVEKAGKLSGIYWRNHYNWEKDPKYVTAIEKVKAMFGYDLFAKMYADAMEGCEQAIVYKGQVTGYYRQIISTERIKLLEGLVPEFKSTYQSTTFNGPVQINIGYRALPIADISAPQADDHLANEGVQPEQPKIDKK